MAAEETNLSITGGPWATLIANRPWVRALTLGDQAFRFQVVDRQNESRFRGCVKIHGAARANLPISSVPRPERFAKHVLRGGHTAVRENLQISGVHLPKLLAQSVCIETTPLAMQTFRLQVDLCKTERQTMFV